MTFSTFHHLIAEPGTRFVPRELGARFAPVLGSTAIDEAQRLRYCGGWLLRDGDEETVAQLQKEAMELDIRCHAITTEGEVVAEATERVLTADLDEGRIFLELPGELIDVAESEVMALDLGVVGAPQTPRNTQQEEMHRWAEGMLVGLSFPHIREGLLGCGLARPNPQVFLAVPDREQFLRIERGTRFPTLLEEAGPQALDALLLFIDRLLTALPEGRALPEVTQFWSDGAIERVLRRRIEERENRLSWLKAWLRVGGTREG